MMYRVQINTRGLTPEQREFFADWINTKQQVIGADVAKVQVLTQYGQQCGYKMWLRERDLNVLLKLEAKHHLADLNYFHRVISERAN